MWWTARSSHRRAARHECSPQEAGAGAAEEEEAAAEADAADDAAAADSAIAAVVAAELLLADALHSASHPSHNASSLARCGGCWKGKPCQGLLMLLGCCWSAARGRVELRAEAESGDAALQLRRAARFRVAGEDSRARGRVRDCEGLLAGCGDVQQAEAEQGEHAWDLRRSACSARVVRALRARLKVKSTRTWGLEQWEQGKNSWNNGRTQRVDQ